jgi:hypothetical protein
MSPTATRDTIEEIRKIVAIAGRPGLASEHPASARTLAQWTCRCATLLTEIDRLGALLSAEPELVNMHLQRGELAMDVKHWSVHLLAASFAETFRGENGINVVQMTLHPQDDAIGPLLVTIQRKLGKSPGRIIDELKTALQGLLHSSDLDPPHGDPATARAIEQARRLLTPPEGTPPNGKPPEVAAAIESLRRSIETQSAADGTDAAIEILLAWVEENT